MDSDSVREREGEIEGERGGERERLRENLSRKWRQCLPWVIDMLAFG